MNRTIELCSKHVGKLRFTLGDDPREIVFTAKHGVGHAMVTAEEAEFFMQVGGAKGDYWTPGRSGGAETEETETEKAGLPDDSKPSESPVPLTVEDYQKLKDADEMAARLAVTIDADALMTMAGWEGNRGRWKRNDWLEALNERIGQVASEA